MRVSNETKVGALTVIAVTLIIIGFNFLKGKTIFKSGNFIYAKYHDTKGLIVSNPVYVNGYQVGTVFEIENLNANLSDIIVAIKLNNNYQIPINSIATIQENPLGTNSIYISLGNATIYLKNGDTVKTAPATSLLGDFMNTLSPLSDQFKKTIDELRKVLVNVNTVMDDQNKANFKELISNLTKTSDNLNKSMASIEQMLDQKGGSIAQTAVNINGFTKNLAENNKKITNIINNLDSTSQAIKDANLNQTIKEIQSALAGINLTLQKLNTGNGTAAKIMNDPSVYTELKNTINSVNTLIDDIKVHPKRYINISVFGKKDKTTPLSKPIADTVTNE
ncbi:MAG: MlaD family protein [Sediminibacterium sp.]|jgi:phospholipid/cholesterol/gamma-HCH transport system substrate-binding protein|nr:MlaD family protein [Sediminibacterium sp.]